MIESQKQIEQNFKILLLGISLKMKGKDEELHIEVLDETKKLLQNAKSLAYRQVENSFIKTIVLCQLFLAIHGSGGVRVNVNSDDPAIVAVVQFTTITAPLELVPPPSRSAT